ncbi:hypothetical protein [Pseudosporangium ferrugineum]|uniref:Uncharacterized protein n=1 Tax=Pseudosporangium ferrugineum TaxID=439699 RepID=A0A2T0SFD6_9ACTN|nr:hypothetical protein [Pseudosporangium ferrugineum]PRY32128.1 hypothetical protein CLV70_102339 [Pseudosporangium ferrugineum]
MPRRVRLEVTAAGAGAALLAIALTWPTLRHPWTTIPGDLGDPTLQAWQVAWAGHALLTDPLNWIDSNTFYPAPYTLAYSDTLLGYAPAGWFGHGPQAAVLRYNLLYVAAHALAAFGAYVLVRQLGARPAAATVAAVAWAYAPWRLAHSGHLNVLSTGGIALCLAMLARGHGWSLRHGHRPDRHSPWWAFGGWLVAAWQISLGFGIGLPLVYVLLAGCAAYAWFLWRGRRRGPDRRLLIADLAGAVIFALTCASLGRLFLRVVELNPQARRDLEWTRMYSPPLRGYFVPPADSWLWGEHFTAARDKLSWPPEMALMTGAALMVLGVLGLFWSVFPVRHRVLLGAGLLTSAALGLGSNLGADGEPGYLTLSKILPGWEALRTPGRLMIWISLFLAVLAAGLLSRPVGRWRALIAIPLVLVLAEGVNRTPHPRVPDAPAAMRAAPEPMLVLPSDGLGELHIALWSTDGFPRVVNGLASFVPAGQEEIRRGAESFPDPASVALLRAYGIRSVVVLPDELGGTPWEGVPDRPADGLGITREEVGDALVYRLS